ncbi:RPII140-upstream gene protein [Rhipicephalus microplus]|uniref:Complex I assembly factor TIMMDC1, mitochondrial n=1 Tax=Rhipicephalus microplus TaxID=6941 RepID=A0A6M2CNW5_RHIMP
MQLQDESKISRAPEGLRSEMFRPEDFRESRIMANETGMDRVKIMFDLSRGLGPELMLVQNASLFSGVCGALAGGWNYARTARANYIRKNQGSTFLNPKQAMRELQDTMFLQFLRGAWKLGWRMTAFSAIYMTVAVAGFTYRNKFGIAENVAAGALSGFFFKLNMGVRGSLVGAGLGSLLGLASGSALTVGTKALGVTVKEFRYWQHDYWMQEYSEKKALWLKEKAERDLKSS